MILENKLTQIIDELAIKNNILIAILFGSQAKGDNNQDSDVDIAFLFEDQFLSNKNVLELRSEFISVFSSKIKKDCDIIFINQAPPLLKYQAVKYGKEIYRDDDFDYGSFYSRALKEYFDFKYYQDYHNEELLQRIKKGGKVNGG